jgi:hypothetical protein
MIRSWPGCLMAAAALVFLVLTAVRAADEPPGILWETTSQMVMEGMPMQMPVQRLKVCTAKVWTQPPPAGDQNCTASNFQRIGADKVTWTVQCTGEMNMTGVGEITFEGTDAYSGEIKFTGEEMSMTTKLTGKKIGTCDNPR